MSAQITVRLPGDLVSFLDEAVSDGRVLSRAALVTQASERKMHRQAAVNGAGVLERQGISDELDELVMAGGRQRPAGEAACRASPGR
ncbi:hypothetical protein BKH23_06865 [Actinomyces oris]|nr:hypothetical protein BKH23_06865 [Actinomyces oris]